MILCCISVYRQNDKIQYAEIWNKETKWRPRLQQHQEEHEAFEGDHRVDVQSKSLP